MANETDGAAISPLVRHLQLRPHGDNLLTSSGAFWLFSARSLIVAMALSEAVAWGRLGYVFGERSIGWIAAAAVSMTIFMVVWMIDISLITMDRAWREHAAAILGYRTSERGLALRNAFTVLIRIGLLFGSLYITAPYLAQVVFYKDIQRYIDAEAVSNIDKTRQEFVAKLDAGIAAKTQDVSAQRATLEREVAGAGLSGRYGFGPAAQTMAGELKKQEAAREQLVAEKHLAIASYDQLARDWRGNRDTLAATYNVPLPQTSILENSRALEALRQRPEYQSTELALKAFLAFVFFGLLLLKLFEPTSIRLYMSEVLQQEYARYKAGTFDEVLPDTERSTLKPSPMTPQRLYDFLAHEWAKDHHLQAKRDRGVVRMRAMARGVAEFEGLRAQLNQDVDAADGAYQAASAAAEDARQSLKELSSAMDILKAGIREYEQELKRWERDEDDLVDLPSRSKHLKFNRQLREKLQQATERLERLKEHRPAEERRLERARSDQQHWRAELDQRRNELSDISKRIRDLRRASSEAELVDERAAS